MSNCSGIPVLRNVFRLNLVPPSTFKCSALYSHSNDHLDSIAILNVAVISSMPGKRVVAEIEFVPPTGV